MPWCSWRSITRPVGHSHLRQNQHIMNIHQIKAMFNCILYTRLLACELFMKHRCKTGVSCFTQIRSAMSCRFGSNTRVVHWLGPTRRWSRLDRQRRFWVAHGPADWSAPDWSAQCDSGSVARKETLQPFKDPHPQKQGSWGYKPLL